MLTLSDMLKACENWVLQPYRNARLADEFIRERLSLVELDVLVIRRRRCQNENRTGRARSA
jgi:hypothetical protein